MTPDAIDRLCERIAEAHAVSYAERGQLGRDVRAALEGERERSRKLLVLLDRCRVKVPMGTMVYNDVIEALNDAQRETP